MKTKFNKASQTDGTLVTLNLAQLDDEFDRTLLVVGSQVFVNIAGHEVVFYVNRVRKGKAVTAVTHCFPRFMRLPQIGRPIYAEVLEVY